MEEKNEAVEQPKPESKAEETVEKTGEELSPGVEMYEYKKKQPKMYGPSALIGWFLIGFVSGIVSAFLLALALIKFIL